MLYSPRGLMTVFCVMFMAYAAVKAEDNTNLQLNISVTAPTGEDLPNKITVFHRHYDPTQQQKRAVSRPQNHCDHPHFGNFVASVCASSSSPQQYKTYCAPTVRRPIGGYVVTLTGQCTPDEICVNSTAAACAPAPPALFDQNIPQRTAYCVAMENFVEIARNRLGTIGEIQVPVPKGQAGSPSTVAAQAVLTGDTNTTNLIADSLSIIAVQQKPVFQVLPNGTARCTECSSVGLQPLPVGTEMLSARMALKRPAAGHLFLTTLSI